MWIFCGAILGLFLGGITGGMGAGVAGAILGAIVGWVISLMSAAGRASEDAAQPREIHPASSQFNQSSQIEFFQKALEDIHWRLQRLEQKEGLSGSALQGNEAKASASVQAAAQYVPKATPTAAATAAAATSAAASASDVFSPTSISARVVGAGLNIPQGDDLRVAGVSDVLPTAAAASGIANIAARLDTLEAAPSSTTPAIPSPTVAATIPALGSAAATRELTSPTLTPTPASAATVNTSADWRAAPLPVTAASPVEASVPKRAQPSVQPTSQPAAQPKAAAQSQAKPPLTPSPAATQEPPQDSLFTRLLAGNIVAKIGVIVLFFGVSFLLKYAFDRTTFPPWAPLLGSVVAAIALFVAGGWVFKKAQDDDGKNRKLYGLILMGGASGLMYLNVFFAMKQFSLISPTAAFVLFFFLCIGTIVLAVKLDARVLAALAMFGGFLAPVLASTGSNNHVLLFSYYLMLNLFVLGVSWFKSWRELNLIGFVHTFIIATVWGVRSDGGYTADKFGTTEPFLLAFFFIYLCVPILFAFRQPPKLKGLVDGTLVFGTPLSVFMAQIALVNPLTTHQPNQILAYTALGATIIYGALAWVLRRSDDGESKFKVLADAHLALAVVFLTLIPYYLFVDAKGVAPTFALWTLEAAAIFWIACRQNSQLARTFALLLHGGAACYFALNWQSVTMTAPWLNATVVGCFLIAAGAWILAYLIFKYSEVLKPYERFCEYLLLTWGALWLLAGVDSGTHAQLLANISATATDAVANAGRHQIVARSAIWLAVVAGLVVIAEFLGRAFSWDKVRNMQAWQLPFFGLALMAQTLSAQLAFHPLMQWCAWAWPISLAVFVWALQRQDKDGLCSPQRMRAKLGTAFGMLLLSWEAAWRFADAQYYWVLGMGLAAILLSAALFYITKTRLQATPAQTAEGKGSPSQFSNSSLADAGLVWGLFIWVAGGFGLFSLSANAGTGLEIASANLLFSAATVAVLELLGRALDWRLMRRTHLLLIAAQIFTMAQLFVVLASHPLAPEFWLAWLGSVAVLTVIAWLQNRDGLREPADQGYGIALYLAWFVLASLCWETNWNAHYKALTLTWELAMQAGLLLATMVGLKLYFGDRLNTEEPADANAGMFRAALLLPVFAVLFLGSVYSHFKVSGSAPPLPYLPLLNPIDIVHFLWFGLSFVMAKCLYSPVNRASSGIASNSNALLYAMAANAFLWLNAVAARTVHHYVGIPFEFNTLFNSAALQTVLSLLWTGTAWALMVAAGRLGKRSLWMLGGALLAVVVAKLFLRDAASVETIWKIVLFLGVGGLLVVIGYVSPMPPSSEKINDQQR